MPDLKGKSVVVTGAPRGIGRATAKRFDEAGAHVYLAANEPASELESAAAECRRENASVSVGCGVFDLAEAEAPARMIEAALEILGRVDVLVNNAGIRIRHPFGEYSAAEFDRLIGVN